MLERATKDLLKGFVLSDRDELPRRRECEPRAREAAGSDEGAAAPSEASDESVLDAPAHPIASVNGDAAEAPTAAAAVEPIAESRVSAENPEGTAEAEDEAHKTATAGE